MKGFASDLSTHLQSRLRVEEVLVVKCSEVDAGLACRIVGACHAMGCVDVVGGLNCESIQVANLAVDR